MRNYFNYFTEVEEYFLTKRGTHLLVSPLDWCLIELWKENEIPLHVVLRGIDRSFEGIESAGKKPPRSLSYCHPAVVQVFEEYTQAMVGASPGAAETQGGDQLSQKALLRHLEDLQESLQQHLGEAFTRARSLLAALRAEVAAQSEVSYEQIDRDLNQIGVRVMVALQESMDPSELKELQAQTKKEMKIYKKHLSVDMYRQLEANYLARKTRERYGLPEFSLLEAVSGESDNPF
mgnify:CR=1 FL=1